MSVNAMQVSAGQALEVLRAGWDVQSKFGVFASYMLHGQPGIGKTQIAEELARHIGGKLYDVRLTTIETSDLRGLPYYDHEKKQTMYYRPEDLPNSSEPAVLFLDELTSASPYLQPTVYGLLQERRIGQHQIPANTFIVAAGNGVEDGAVAYEMGTAIADRLIHMNVIADPTDWVENYAIPNDLHPAVVAFIKIRPDLLQTITDCMKNDKMIAATPRSWTRVSDMIKVIPDRKIRRIMVAGIVGDAVANEFFIIADDIEATVQVTEMVKRPRSERLSMYPKTMHGLNAMVLGLLGQISKETIGASVEIIVDMKRLSKLRVDPEFKLHPLAELATFGMEFLIKKAMDAKLTMEILACPAYQDYERERKETGLVSV